MLDASMNPCAIYAEIRAHRSYGVKQKRLSQSGYPHHPAANFEKLQDFAAKVKSKFPLLSFKTNDSNTASYLLLNYTNLNHPL